LLFFFFLLLIIIIFFFFFFFFFLLLLFSVRILSAQVPLESGLRWARERGLFFLETSAKDNVNVQKAFQQLLIGTL
jgi:hypothetical protein